MLRFCREFLIQESGQDLAEYCLITALLALVALGIFWKVSGGMQAIWGTANSTLGVSTGSTNSTQTNR
ncbi:hypothetical protein SBA3_2270016 [Candidatus Sulfopaludibacter sp. SbA3]|nr:hypothetical protein SBA3_2270016 [Candidatus Sulfopaludibacter sp. SbA3]